MLSRSDWYQRNKNKQIAKQRRWRRNNPAEAKERTRRYHLKSKCGITPEEFDLIFASQGQRCAVCRTNKPNHFRGWGLDHCHKTGVGRGVLCHDCNVARSHFKDNPIILASAAKYLRKHDGGRRQAA